MRNKRFWIVFGIAADILMVLFNLGFGVYYLANNSLWSSLFSFLIAAAFLGFLYLTLKEEVKG